MRIIQILATIFILCATCAAGAFLFLTEHPWVDFSALAHYQPGKPSIVLDDEGKEWARFQLDKREPTKLSDVPRIVIQAFLAAEDRNFYAHAGISWRGIIRSVIVNLYRGRRAQGASTITQQLVKLLFFDTQKTFTRKIKEQLLACMVEQQFTKDQILEIYLNHIYFGCGIYGIQAAAQRFWQKDLQQLTLDEAATLAGIIRAPTKYCPIDHPHNAFMRRNVVLRCMYEAHYITHEDYQASLQQPLQLAQHDATDHAPHAREMVRQAVEDLVGKEMLYTGGLVIQTTLNQKLQTEAAQTFTKHVTALQEEQIPDVDGALITLDTATAGIKALVGGYQYKTSQFNRALQARRQMGSTFKPLIYAAALNEGAQFTDVKIDQPISCLVNNKLWEPQNANKRFEGPMTLAYALTRSNNSIPIQLVLELGTDKIIAYAQACQLRGPLYPYPSLALGCVDGSPYEVAGMFNIFVNHGIYVEPHLISWVKDQLGNKIWKHTPHTTQVISSQVSSQITKALTSGRKRMLQLPWPACETIGKTGTTNEARTCWYVGSTPAYTTAIYVGRDDSKPMGKTTYAVRTALPLWLEFNNRIKQPQTNFSYDPRLTEMTVHQRTGRKIWNSSDPESITLLTTS